MRFLILLTTAIVITSCSGNSQQSEKKEDQFIIRTTSKYILVADSSSVQWERYLHQKPTKQTIQLFGAQVEADLGEVEMTTSGGAFAHTGTLTFVDDLPSEAIILFDMESFKLAKEKGNGLFDVKKYPDCELNILQFEKTESSYIASSILTIQEKSNDNEFEVQIERNKSNYSLKGTFKINTLDYPLREQVTAKDVYEDVITVDFSLMFVPVSEKKDTIE
jgi:hypothetical protein